MNENNDKQNLAIINFIKSIYKEKKFIPLHEPRFIGNEKEYLGECIDTTFVSFNHLFDSWGTSQKAISIRVQFNGSTPITAVNYPTGSNTYASQFNSPNRHQVTFTMTEFRA